MNTKLFVALGVLSFATTTLTARADQKAVCDALKDLGKTEYADLIAKADSKRKSNELIGVETAAKLFVTRLTAKHNALLEAVKRGQTSPERVSAALQSEVASQVEEDLLDAAGDSYWTNRHSLGVRGMTEMFYQRGSKPVIIVSSCYRGGGVSNYYRQCVEFDLLSAGPDFKAEIDRQLDKHAGKPTQSEAAYIASRLPDACKIALASPPDEAKVVDGAKAKPSSPAQQPPLTGCTTIPEHLLKSKPAK